MPGSITQIFKQKDPLAGTSAAPAKNVIINDMDDGWYNINQDGIHYRVSSDDLQNILRTSSNVVDNTNSGFAKSSSSADQPPRTNQSSSPFAGSIGVSGTPSAVLGSAASVADPWASQRGQYQGKLNSFMAENPNQSNQYLDQLSGVIGKTANKQPGQYQNALSGLMTGGQSAIANDPSYQWRLDQGMKATQRSNAAKGYLGSGNILTALTDYAQGAASQEYGNQFNRLNALSENEQNRSAQDQATQFNQLFSVGTNQQGVANQQRGEQYNRLAQLAGVNSSSPSAAGGILAQQPGYELQAQNQAFNQSNQSQLLPHQITALQNSNSSSALENIVSQNAFNQMQDAQWQAQIEDKYKNLGKGFY
jgi:hypothetical protein